MATKKGFTIDEHLEIGKELYEISQRLMYLGTKLECNYDRKTSGFAFEAQENVIKLRGQMDAHVYRETNEDARVYFSLCKQE